MRTEYAGRVDAKFTGQKVTLFGWVHRRRDHGGVIFIDLRDREGLVQVVCHPDRRDVFETAEKIRSEYCVEVSGTVQRRPEGTVNATLTSGQIEILCEQLEILNPSVPIPFQLDDDNLSETTRLTHRVLDLRRPAMQKNMMLRYRVSMAVRKFLDAAGLIDSETPMLTRSTPEGARDYLVPSRVHPGAFFALPQSPQLFKQILMVAGMDRYVQICRCFRDEDLRADRQPEFTQVDVEMSFARPETIFGMIEPLMQEIFAVVGHEVATPFERMSYADAIATYGSDKPDLRCGMPIQDMREFFRESSFRVFREIVANGGTVRGFVIRNAGGYSRSEVDGIVDEAKKMGAAGLIWARRSVDGTA